MSFEKWLHLQKKPRRRTGVEALYSLIIKFLKAIDIISLLSYNINKNCEMSVIIKMTYKNGGKYEFISN